ncbi:DUF4234 domain-containing protein [Allofournierella sp.]|uniref:DUF4234 domain-containing protein n=1 Tax=Allofournierella sp. TaxID=1940256 RepID=UPI003AB2BC56
MNKNIVVCILLTIVTCGIYGIYWFWCITETARTVNPAEWQVTGGMAILFSIITCGIYGIYWNYKMGKAFMAINGGADNSVLYLVLSLFGLTIVNYCLIQNDINNAFPVGA